MFDYFRFILSRTARACAHGCVRGGMCTGGGRFCPCVRDTACVRACQ